MHPLDSMSHYRDALECTKGRNVTIHKHVHPSVPSLLLSRSLRAEESIGPSQSIRVELADQATRDVVKMKENLR